MAENVMNRKQWYQSLEDYSKLANQRSELGAFFVKDEELKQLQEKLLFQKRFFDKEMNKLSLEDEVYKKTLDHRLKRVFKKIRDYEPVSKEEYYNTFIKTHPVMEHNIKRHILILFFLLLVLKLFHIF